MKVIFIEDVPNVARAGEAREVADGYGRNYLLPKKLAVLANSQASSVVEAQMKKIAVKRAQDEAEMVELAGKLDGVEVTLKAKAGAKERLYGSITSADIADEINSSTGLVVDKRKIELEEPIRQLGDYEVTIRFTHDIVAVIKLTVVADKVTEEKEEKEEKKEEKKAEAKTEKEEERAGEKAEQLEGKVDEKVKRKVKKAKKAEEKAKKVEEKAKKVEGKVEKVKEKAKKVEDKVEQVEEKAKKVEEKLEKVEDKAEKVEEKVEEAETGE